MDISIVFPAYNAESTVRSTLDSLVSMDTDGLVWEVVVCNNNSSDQTDSIIKSYASKIPLRVVNERKQGMSPSLNRLFDNVSGEIIAMTNDDVILDPQWAKRIVRLTKINPDFDIFGGKITPHFMSAPPDWFRAFQNKHVAFGLTPEAFRNQEVGAGSIFGACMAIRQSILESGIRFNEEIGPNGGEYEMGCETDFLSKLVDCGHRCWFSDEVTLQHMIRSYQFDLGWIYKRARRYGLSMYLKEKKVNFGGVATLAGIPAWRLKFYIQNRIKKALSSRENLELANYYWEVGFFEGYFNKRINHAF